MFDQMESRVRAVVFDLDGTLIDSAPDIAAAVNRMLTGEGHAALSVPTVTGFVGRGLPNLVRQVMEHCGIAPDRHAELTETVIQHYHANSDAHTRPYPGVRDALAALHHAGHPMAICTNKPEAPARTVLHQLGLARYFPVVVGGDTLPTRKPEPQMLAACMHQLSASDCAYVGDSEVDAECALNAGQPFFLYTEGYRKTAIADIPHHTAFSDFRELARLLATA